MKEHAGAQWCARFPTSRDLNDLVQPFRANVTRFIAALRDGRAGVHISATYRPRERAYLMHWCCKIAGGQDPAAVPAMPGVAIDWTCGGNRVAAKTAARAMMQGYAIAFPAALASRHTQKRAIDMTVSFQGAITVRDANGAAKRVAAQTDLYPIGASYGVHKLVSDRPHWSDDGH